MPCGGFQQVNGGRFDDVVEPLEPGSCPVMMLHTVVELFLKFAQADDLPQYEKQMLSVRSFLQHRDILQLSFIRSCKFVWLSYWDGRSDS